ncbi:5'/3'-nucleotidase SurE [Arsenophonus symbiont of Ornithomya chloropus]|uniref:5'/3'-nucleotidase SurE n=1 Tax=Arsenophonus symbiont of Ornithomya chloropus TaxID=634121 RepID=UPI0032B138BC
MLRILLSNDDGVTAPGIQILSTMLRKYYSVQVIAPDRNQSGTSNALTLHKPLRIIRLENGDISVQGTPSDCVYLGVNQLISPYPEIVISGINCGPNLGDDIIYSGTVAAATEGRHLGLPALAISLNGNKHYQTAAEVTCYVLKLLQKKPLSAGNILNINVPDILLSEIQGYKVTRCGSRYASQNVYSLEDPRGDIVYWLGPVGKISDAAPDTDFAAVEAGYVSITPLQVDLTAYKVKKIVKDWLITAEKSESN